jgi:hypothetical protein
VTATVSDTPKTAFTIFANNYKVYLLIVLVYWIKCSKYLTYILRIDARQSQYRLSITGPEQVESKTCRDRLPLIIRIGRGRLIKVAVWIAKKGGVVCSSYYTKQNLDAFSGSKGRFREMNHFAMAAVGGGGRSQALAFRHR